MSDLESSRVTRRSFVRAGLASTLFLGLSLREVSASGGSKLPNILLFLADDLGQEDLGCYGNRACTSPNIDKLCHEGVRFDNAFTMIAACTPSRSSLYTGMYPHSNGAYGFNPIRPGIKTLPHLMRRAGYYTGLIGKVHVEPLEQFPFDYLVPHILLIHGRDIKLYEAAVKNFFHTAGNRPFCLLVPFVDPHRAYPKDARNPHDPAKVQLPPYLPDIPPVREDFARYYDAIRRLDDGVGLVLKQIRRSGHEDNTIVLFTSDHGAAMPYAKANCYDAGIRVPFIVRLPGVTAPGSRSDALIGFIDILPTLLDVAGAEIPAAVQGKSFSPVLRGQSAVHHDAVFGYHTTTWNNTCEYPIYPMRAIRTQRYKYIVNLLAPTYYEAVDGTTLNSPTYKAMKELAKTNQEFAAQMDTFSNRPQEEMYDLRKDPHEMNNLADDPSCAELKAQLRNRLKQHMRETNDPFDIDRPELCHEWFEAEGKKQK